MKIIREDVYEKDKRKWEKRWFVLIEENKRIKKINEELKHNINDDCKKEFRRLEDRNRRVKERCEESKRILRKKYNILKNEYNDMQDIIDTLNVKNIDMEKIINKLTGK